MWQDYNVDIICNSLKENKIIGVFRGKSEIGPRALGNRSIICNPYSLEIKKRLDEEIKFRESYRPYGVIVPREFVSKYWDIDVDAYYMNIIGYNLTNLFVGATHVDNSTRIQTVTKESNEWLYNLLINFGEKTGHPVLINTSFNTKKFPIFNWRQDAFDMYKNCLDGLILDDKMILKERDI